MPSLDELDDLARDLLPRQLEIIRKGFEQAIDATEAYAEALVDQLNRYGAPLPGISLPSISGLRERAKNAFASLKRSNALDVQATPAPTPAPPLWHNPLIRTGAAAAAAAVGLALVYRFAYSTKTARIGLLGHDGSRAEAVVVLGAETAAGRAAVLDLVSRQLVVIATVPSAQDKRDLEEALGDAKGYVRVVAVDSGNAAAVRKAVHTSLSFRYPLDTAGDPFVSPGHGVRVIGVVVAPTSAQRAADQLNATSEMLPLLAAPDVRSKTSVVVSVLTGAPDVRALVIPAVRALSKARLPGAHLTWSSRHGKGMHIEAPQKKSNTRPIAWTAVSYSEQDLSLATALSADLILGRTTRLWTTYVAQSWSLRSCIARIFRTFVSLLSK
ncbi:hypothetical protein MCUN1_001141 [Malassezia cuniculi]|uniref:Uncharacterized protein n=1 Tax=Malassezia cuniculi TaxID=948313 RepID=A0AAF0J5A3_9BASI|nr:hypothetical protein MCUN1_001141 [Malassezia cuniculi]